MTNKLSEVTKAAGAVTNWVAIGPEFREYTAYARAGTASPLDDVTVQLRKATSAGGAGATNHGDAVTGKVAVAASVEADELGKAPDGTPYTHVAAVVTDEASPNTVVSFAVLSQPRFSTYA